MTVKALILAAGYATRLYPLTLDTPKPLLKIGSKTISDRIVEKIASVKEIDEVYLVTNEKFAPHFEKWAKGARRGVKIRVINDHTLTNETRLGAIGDMELVIEEAGVADDLLVLGGDNLFGFDLRDFIAFSREKKGPAIAAFDVKDVEEARRFGIVLVDKDGRIVEFAEKPAQPRSTLAAMCVYFFPRNTLQLLKKYLAKGLNKDQPGHYIRWLSENHKVYAYTVAGEWFDIGDKDLLKIADKVYREKEKRGV